MRWGWMTDENDYELQAQLAIGSDEIIMNSKKGDFCWMKFGIGWEDCILLENQWDEI